MERWVLGLTLALLLAPPAARAQTVADSGQPSDRRPASSDGPISLEPAREQEPSTQAPPPPRSTGFRSLLRETGSDLKAFPRRRSTWVILGAGAAAAGLSHLEDSYVSDHIVGSDAVATFFAPGKWIGSFWIESGAAAGVYLIGRYAIPPGEDGSRSNKVSHLGMDLLRAQILSQAFVQGIKRTVRRDRPTGECCSFPSGHAATAFATASVLERHFGGYRGAWPTLLVAGYVAASRIHDNRHFLSDVVFGSAVGMAIGWTVVGRHGRKEFALVPVPVRGGIALAVVRTEER